MSSEQLQFEDEEVPITLRRAWDRALRLLATRVNKPAFETHIRAIRPLALTEENEENSGKNILRITLGVPGAFTREWVEKRHATLITSVLEEILDRDVQIQFALTPKGKTGGSLHPSSQNLSLFDAPQKPVPPAVAPGPAASSAPRTAALPALFGDPAEEDASTGPETPPVRRQAAENGLRREGLPPSSPRPDSPPSGGSKPRPATPLSTSGSGTPQQRSTRSGSSDGQADAPQLNSRYTFDSFVTGSSNRLAHAGAQAVAQGPGQVYNPLFLYGPSGLGKTHLMHAIGNESVRTGGMDPARIAYISGEAFTTHFITSLREHRAEEFRRKWRSVDLWLVDDIQFIAGKESTKEEFFHTFNTLYQLGKQIVICSDRSPRDLRMMDDRLRSRFECGLIADIAPPDLETRLAILHRKAESERMRIPDEVLLYMARLVQSNIRTLEGALVRLIAYASLVNSPVTTELAASILERYYINPGIGAGAPAKGGGEEQQDAAPTSVASDTASGSALSSGSGGRLGSMTSGAYTGYSSAAARSYGSSSGFGGRITAEMVQRVVAKRFGMAQDELTGKRRDRDVVNARQIAMHLMRELTEMSLPGIGQLFGGRDHSTVAHACDKVRAQIPLDDDLRSLVEDLTLQVRAQASG